MELAREAETKDVEQVPAPPAPVLAAPRHARLLELQRTAGNRAVNQLLRKELGPQQQGTVSKHVEEKLVTPSAKGETSFHWDARFAYEIWDDSVVAYVNIRMDDSWVGEATGKKVRDEAREAFREIWNRKYAIVTPHWYGDDVRVLSLGIDFIQSDLSDEPIHAYVTLMPGAPSSSEPTNRSVWHVDEPARVHAHEPGHLFGLKDEYVDTNVESRSDVGKQDVHEDNSIMGNFPAEGIDTAQMKARHALAIAKMVYADAGKSTDITVKKL